MPGYIAQQAKEAGVPSITTRISTWRSAMVVDIFNFIESEGKTFFEISLYILKEKLNGQIYIEDFKITGFFRIIISFLSIIN